MIRRLSIHLFFAALSGMAVASTAAATPSVDDPIVASDAFLEAHPDLRYRQLGMKAYLAGNMARALEHFRRAARYADKPSQGMVGELLWEGRGVARDRALAFAWLEVAAERGFPVLVAQRDRYGQALDASERRRASSLGPGLRAEFGDRVAQPRLEALLRRARSATTGSRTGLAGNLQIILPGPGGDVRVDGSRYYQEKFWEPEAYWAWQAEEWKAPPKPRVEVAPLQPRATPPGGG